MAKGQLCYSKSDSEYLVWSKTQGDGYLVCKGEDESELGDVIITVRANPNSWVCKKYNCSHEISTSCIWSSGGEGSSKTIPHTPNNSETVTVNTTTECSSEERPLTNIIVTATQKGSAGLIKKSKQYAGKGSGISYTVTLDNDGKLSSLN